MASMVAQRWAFLLLSIHAALLAYSAACHSPTWDEPFHVVGGVRRWECGRFDLNIGNPPLVGMIAALPVLATRPQTDWSRVPNLYHVGLDFMAANGPRSLWMITLARWALIPVTLLGGYVCYRWARELYGDAGGLVALTVWCFGPNILAHGQVVTGDMPATALGITAFYAFWKWLSRPTVGRAALAGLLLGVAELSKFVWVILYVFWPVLWIVWRRLDRGRPARLSLAHEAGHGLLILLLSIYVVNLGYAFEKPLQPLRSSELGKTILGRIDLFGSSDEASAGSGWLGSLPVPFPQKYVAGIGAIADVRVAPPPSYLRGEVSPDGWWYYYPYAMLVKLPVGTLALLGLACCLALSSRGNNDAWKTEWLLLLAPFLVVICFVTWVDAGQRLRYALPMLPFVMVLTGRASQALVDNRRLLAVLVGCLLAWSVARSLWVYPHSLSYFYGLAGGPMRGHEHLLLSTDWGQDLFYLKEWYDRHPAARPFHLAYYGSMAPRLARIEFSLPPRNLTAAGLKPGAVSDRSGPRPGWFAVSVHVPRTSRSRIPDGRGGRAPVDAYDYDYFLRFRPIAMAGYSIYVYHVECDEANAVRKQLGMPELECDPPEG
jgi:4-amino-4-deoxy-L-arabinose transferase-like glycosyltransferase